METSLLSEEAAVDHHSEEARVDRHSEVVVVLQLFEEAEVLPFEEAEVLRLFEEAEVLRLFEEAEVLPLFEEVGVLPLFEEAGVLPLFKEAGVLPLFKEAGVLPLFEEVGVLPLFEEAGVLPLFKEAEVHHLLGRVVVILQKEMVEAAPHLQEIETWHFPTKERDIDQAPCGNVLYVWKRTMIVKTYQDICLIQDILETSGIQTGTVMFLPKDKKDTTATAILHTCSILSNPLFLLRIPLGKIIPSENGNEILSASFATSNSVLMAN
jgi:hypothetical protein